MNRHDIDPRYFGDTFGYSRAVLVEQPSRWLMVAGHESRDDDGGIAHEGDIRGQIETTFTRLEETIVKAGFTLADVVQLHIFTTDIKQMTENYYALTGILAAKNCTPTSTMVEVAALSDPKMLLEIEAVAAA